MKLIPGPRWEPQELDVYRGTAYFDGRVLDMYTNDRGLNIKGQHEGHSMPFSSLEGDYHHKHARHEAYMWLYNNFHKDPLERLAHLEEEVP